MIKSVFAVGMMVSTLAVAGAYDVAKDLYFDRSHSWLESGLVMTDLSNQTYALRCIGEPNSEIENLSISFRFVDDIVEGQYLFARLGMNRQSDSNWVRMFVDRDGDLGGRNFHITLAGASPVEIMFVRFTTKSGRQVMTAHTVIPRFRSIPSGEYLGTIPLQRIVRDGESHGFCWGDGPSVYPPPSDRPSPIAIVPND